MNETLKRTVDMLTAVLNGTQLKINRNPLDLFADRIRQAATEPTLIGFMERLIVLMDSTGEKMENQAASFIAACKHPDALSVLKWLSQYSRLASLIAGTRDLKEKTEALEAVEINHADQAPGKAIKRRPFEVGIEMVCSTPLAHGGDTKSGNATLFRRMSVLSDTGQVLILPYFAGNALRGIIRDILADHLIVSLGMQPRRDRPPVALWFFHCLYAGGSLEENSLATKALSKRFGNNGSIKVESILEFRDTLPSLSVLGTAAGNRILCGRAQFGDLRPRCAEWNNGDIPTSQLFEWLFLTRREDHEEHSEHHGMIANTECLKAGVRLEGGIDFDLHASEIEKSAIARGLQLLQKYGRIGAENRRDFGMVEITFDGLPSPDLYDHYLADHKQHIVTYLNEIGAINHASSEPDSQSNTQGKTASGAN
jgi:hypothetical protein